MTHPPLDKSAPAARRTQLWSCRQTSSPCLECWRRPVASYDTLIVPSGENGIEIRPGRRVHAVCAGYAIALATEVLVNRGLVNRMGAGWSNRLPPDGRTYLAR